MATKSNYSLRREAKARGLSERDTLIHLYKELGCQTAVAEHLGVSSSAVHNHMKKHNLRHHTILVPNNET